MTVSEGNFPQAIKNAIELKLVATLPIWYLIFGACLKFTT